MVSLIFQEITDSQAKGKDSYSSACPKKADRDQRSPLHCLCRIAYQYWLRMKSSSPQ